MRTLPIIASTLVLGLAACAPSHQGGYYEPDHSSSKFDHHHGPAVVEDARVDSHQDAMAMADSRGGQFDEVQIVNDGQPFGGHQFDNQRHDYPDHYFGQNRTAPPVRYMTRNTSGHHQGHQQSNQGYRSNYGPYGPGLDHEAPVPSPNSEDVGIGPAQIAETQATLRQLGFDPGRTDGVFGPATEQAIIGYTTHQGMPTDGAVTHSLMSYLRSDLNTRIRAQSRMSGGQHHY